MATTVREGTNGREKKGILPSQSRTKKTTKSASPSSSSDDKTSLSSSEKPVPNYLKPTMSSRRESSSFAKRPSTDSSMQRPTLDRRRSFNNPPSPARLQKAFQGASPSNLLEKPSQSFSSRPIESLSRAPTKDAKIESSSSSFKPKTMKRSITLGTQRDGNAKVASSTKKASKSATTERSVEAHDKDLRFDNVISDHEVEHVGHEVEHVNHEVQSVPDISEMPVDKEQLGDHPQVETESKNAEQEKAKAHKEEEEEEQNTHLGYDQVEKAAVEEGETREDQQYQGDHVEEENIDKDSQESIERPSDRQSEIDAEEEETEDNTTAAEENGVKEEVMTNEELKEELPNNEKQGEESGEELNEEEEMENAVKPPKPEAQNLSVVKPQQQQPASAEKKEAQVYNDVIEETASKLMENRKNKVRALAGAFETIISLQETK